jgi:hypothetical protein
MGVSDRRWIHLWQKESLCLWEEDDAMAYDRISVQTALGHLAKMWGKNLDGLKRDKIAEVDMGDSRLDVYHVHSVAVYVVRSYPGNSSIHVGRPARCGRNT